MLALGLWVLAARREPANVAFAAYTVAWCVGLLYGNLVIEVGHDMPLARDLWALLSLAVVGTLALLLRQYPVRYDTRDRGALAVAAALALVVGAAWLATNASGAGDRSLAVQGEVTPFVLVAIGTLWAGWWGALTFLTLRWSRLDDLERRSTALMSAALVLWPAFRAGDAIILGLASGASLFFAAFAFAGLWLWNAVRGGGRTARNVGWLTLLVALAAMIERTLVGPDVDLWGYGVTRLLGAAILAYAIVRHQLLGIDVKVRWTISRSTVAAAFVAAFFVASEGAQILFGAGNEWVGLAAAGALVFALAPLQRAAERLAEKAVPSTAAASPTGAPEREEMYRSAVRLALRDRRLARSEERELFRLARGLGLDADRAHAILVDLESGEKSG